MPESTKTKVITLICERAVDLSQHLNENALKDEPNVEVVKYPCSGMIQPLMVEAAMKAGASGVIVCGCQIGDCYYREGNKMIRERLLGERPPGLKKTVDRRRVIGLWLSKPQTGRFLSEAKEFVAFVGKLNADEGPPKVEPPKPAPAAKPQPEAGKPTPAPKSDPEAKPATPGEKGGTEKAAKDATKPADEKSKAQKEKTEGKPAGKQDQSSAATDKPDERATKKTEELEKSESGAKPVEDSKDKA